MSKQPRWIRQMMVQRWTKRKPTAGLICQSPSLWMVTRSVRFQAFHEQILGKFEAFLRIPFRLPRLLGWLNLEYLLPSLLFVARFFSDPTRTSKFADFGNPATFARSSQESTASYRKLLQPICALHQQASMQAFPLTTPSLGAIQSVSRTSIQSPVSLPASKRNGQTAAPPPLWSSPLVHHEGKERGDAESLFQIPITPPQVLRSSALVSAPKTSIVLEETKIITTPRNGGLRVSSAPEQIGLVHPLEPSNERLAPKTPREKKSLPIEGVIFPELEFSGAHQIIRTRPQTETQHQADSRRQRGFEEQNLQYTQPMATATTMMARTQQKKNKFVPSQTDQFTVPSKPPVSPELSNLELNRMADQVYRLIARKMQIENERQGKWY